MSMIDDIVVWCQNIAPWQADAVGRMLAHGDLTTADKDELYRMLKAEFGLLKPGESAPKPIRPQPGAVSGAPATQTQVSLHAIEDVHNVNAIPDGSRLPFGTTGLTVIYGQNGSGKSGYARVLKRACKARDTEEHILPNIRPAPGSTTQSQPASAGIKVQVGTSQPQVIAWSDGQHPDVLTNVAVFDSSCARITVEEDNAPLYMPYGADVFPRLGELMTEFKRRLSQETPKTELVQPAGVLLGTQSDAFLKSLSAGTTAAALTAASSWTDADGQRLIAVNELVTKDPVGLASQVDAKCRRLEQFRDDLVRLDSVVSDSAVASLDKLYGNVRTAEEASEAFAASISGEPLPGIGSAPWRKLYEAARDYSTSKAYPGKEFPNVEEDARCVLCMQPLLSEAAERMKRFHKFMEDKTAAAVAEAKRLLKVASDALLLATAPAPESYVDVLGTLKEREPAVAASSLEQLLASTNRLLALKKSPAPDLRGELPKHVPIATVNLEGHIKVLAAEADSLRSQAEPDKQNALLRERNELQSRKALAEYKNAVEQHVVDLIRKDAYARCVASVDTFSISKKGKDMVTATFTPEFQRLLTEELKAMDAENLRILPRPLAKAGETCHKLSLDGACKTTRADISDVLSEGEHRVVAIAGFLAELTASGRTGPIVLDDPVSSLDHVFRDLIAKRLVTEAAKRQVIVFTHDISLLLELETQATKVGNVPTAFVTVSKRSMTPGYANPGLPSQTKNFTALLAEIRQELSGFAGSYDSDRTRYNRQAANLYDRLRGAIDTFVEEMLLNKTVRRHVSGVSVDRLDVVECTTDAYKQVQLGYTEAGEWGEAHSNARPLNIDRPKPADVLAFISKLEALAASTKARQKVLLGERAAALKPRPGQLG